MTMFQDGRSQKVAFLAHCLLNQNAISDGTAVRPAGFPEMLSYLLEHGVGIVQLPCPELLCLGLDRGDPQGAERPVVVENTRIRRAMAQAEPSRRLAQLVEDTMTQLLEYRRYGFQVVGILGANRSPCCGVPGSPFPQAGGGWLENPHGGFPRNRRCRGNRAAAAGTRRAYSTEGGGPMKRGWLSCLLLLLLLAGCAGSGENDAAADLGYTRIGAQQAKEIMDQAPDAVVLDVREAEEYASGHIPGAVLLPVGTISEETAAQAIPTKDATVLVYCRSGNRSQTASAALAQLGYTQVYEFGGIQDWPYEVEQGAPY